MPILYFLAAWFLGLALATLLELPLLWLWIGAGLSLGIAITIWRTSRWRLLPLILLALCLAGLRFQLTRPKLDETHLASYHQAEAVQVTGRILTHPAHSERSQRLRVAVASLITSSGNTVRVQGELLIQTERYPEFRYGQQIQATGLLETPESSPEFDYRAYLARQGIHSSMAWPDITVIGEGAGTPLGHWLDAFQQRASSNLRRLLPDPQGALLRGILLGNDDDLSPHLNRAFQQTGMTHIIAISGFNIALLTAIMLHSFTPLAGAKWSVLLAGTVIALYTILVGADASVVRAALMGGISLFSGRLLGRTSHGPTVLLLIGCLMTAWRPDWLWDVGFQLSFAATLSLMLYAEPLNEWVRARLLYRLPAHVSARLLGWLSEAVLLTMAAQILTLPLMVFHFGQLSLVSLLANALILPAQPAVMIWGGLTTLIAFAEPVLAQPFAWVSWLFLAYTISLVELLATVPWAVTVIEVGPAGAALIYGFIALLSWLPHRDSTAVGRNTLANLPLSQWAATGALLGTVLLWMWVRTMPDGQLHVYFLDVGQGDAILMETPTGQFILIDGGQFPAQLQEQLSDHLPFWRRSLDMVVATHGDADHVGGLPALLDRYEVKQLLTNGEAAGNAGPYHALLERAEDQAVPIRGVSRGERIQLDQEIFLEVVHPGFIRSDSRNNNSIVLRLTYHHFSLLMTGDIEQETENLLSTGNLLSPTYLLKVAHHGSESSTTDPFLRLVAPRAAVISAGADNRFGHPDDQVLQRLAHANIPVLRTDQHGTIEVRTDGTYLYLVSHR